MSAHTPGPWTFAGCRKDSNYSKTLVGIVTTNVGNVARTYPKATDGREEVEANGHLIAAAPELLEALERSLNQLDALERSLEVNSTGALNFTGLPPPSTTPSYIAARAALAKARGE